jgi:DNA-binding beta-propeller fold protein YncE
MNIPTFQQVASRVWLNLTFLLCMVSALGIFAAPLAKDAAPAKFEHPIMVDSDGPGTFLFAIDTWGSMHELRVNEKTLEESRSVSLPSAFSPSDMSYSGVSGQESVMIAGVESGHGTVQRFDLDGRTLQRWNFRNICSGIDVSVDRKAAYVATSDSKEIYRIDLQGTASTYVASIPEAAKLGPLALDDAHQKIYVADVAAGAIYEYTISTNTSKVFVTGLSAPTALSYDPDAARLYIADPGQRGIFTVDTRASRPVARKFVSNPLKSPYGMALISKDRMAVADYTENSIFVFSGKGAMLFRFPSNN